MAFCSPEEEETRLAAQAAAGSEPAIALLLARHRPGLLRLAFGMTGDLALAEDIVQESFILVFRELRGLRRPASFYPWLRRLAVRKALREKRRWRVVSLPAEEPENAGPAGTTETRVAVWQVLGAIPPPLRVVLILREMEQLEYREIAAELRIPVGTVRSRLHCAREQFRRAWQAAEGEGHEP